VKRLSLVAVLALLAGSGARGGQLPAAEDRTQPAFRGGIDMVSLNVTVTDARTQYFTGLGPDDFEVFEEGVRQEVVYFANEPLPIALSLLLDSSASMEAAMPTLQAAASNFVRRLTPRDLAEVIGFDTRVTVIEPFTSDHDALHDAVGSLTVGGSTSLYTAIYVALHGLARLPILIDGEVRRQALIVFSDGEDTSSLVAFEDVLEMAKRSETAIYTILLRGPDVAPAGYRNADYVMRLLASETGGRSFSPGRIQDLSGAYSQIAEELSNQYTLGYVSGNPSRDGAWRRLTVQVKQGGASARTRRGYYAPTDP
jgi:Ca-activated chloride channel homolog